MASFVKSVESFSLSISATNSSDSGTLTESQTTANCVPFITSIVTSVATAPAELSSYQLDAYFSGSTVVIERDKTDGAVRAEVSVVEFDPTYVTVQSDTWQIASASLSTTETITTIDQTAAFLYCNSYQWSGFHYPVTHQIRARFTSNTVITFDRDGQPGTADGHYYVVEADSGDFSVESLDIALSSVSSNTGTITSVTEGKSFVLGSFKIDSSSYRGPDDVTADVVLTNDTTVTMQRIDSTNDIDWHGYVVESAGADSIERGTITGQGATASQDVTITLSDADRAESTAHVAGHFGNMGGGSFDGDGDSGYLPDSFVELTLPSANTLTVKHSTQGSADNDISWEVIHWSIGAVAADRRVMVIS